MTSSPGTYRIGDGAPVSVESAQALWASMARDALVDVARRYNAVITVTALAEDVQKRSGVRTKLGMSHWIDAVLAGVADECARRDEPLLSALCVGDDGSVGDGYGAAVERARGTVPLDADLQAADERLSCYRHFGAELPPDGGRPQITRRVAQPAPARAPRAAASGTRRASTTPRAPRRVERPVAICPTCFTQLPASGRCDTCS
jgi:hypothetical protein